MSNAPLDRTSGAGLPLTFVNPATLDSWKQQTDTAASRWMESSGFTAQPGSVLLLPDAESRIGGALAGVGAITDPLAFAFLPLALPTGEYRLESAGLQPDPAVVRLGWTLGSYQFLRYRRTERTPARLLIAEGSDAVSEASEIGEACCLVRDLVNTPAEDMGPEQLESAVRSLASTHSANLRSVVGEDLLGENFPAIHAVGRASHRSPRMIELDWGQPEHPLLAIVGKGVCFDTGGLDMKPPEGMRWMKKDMGGAAHAIALARLVMARKLPVRLKLLIPAVENAVAGNAYRPGDVLRTRAGLSVEIDNTDAEGRVVLCDALTYAVEASPDLLIDFATLTGAARIALGPDLPALFCNDDGLRDEFLAASAESGDPLWPMPLWQPYRRYLKSGIADLVNTGPSRMAGCITAALYLDHFVPATQPWCHIDVFAWNDSDRPGQPQGGEAQSLRAAWALLKRRYGKPRP